MTEIMSGSGFRLGAPAGGSPQRKARKFRPEISAEACKGCLVCVYACRKFGGDVLVESDERTELGGVIPNVKGECTGCRWCERFCPDFAISVEEVEPC